MHSVGSEWLQCEGKASDPRSYQTFMKQHAKQDITQFLFSLTRFLSCLSDKMIRVEILLINHTHFTVWHENDSLITSFTSVAF